MNEQTTMIEVTKEQHDTFLLSIEGQDGFYTGQDVGRTHGMGIAYLPVPPDGGKVLWRKMGTTSEPAASWSWVMDMGNGEIGTAKRVWSYHIAERYVPSPTPVTMPMIEERYIVIKLKHLTEDQEDGLRNKMDNLGIDTVDCMVVEKGWPMYDDTVNSVLTWAATDAKKVEADDNV